MASSGGDKGRPLGAAYVQTERVSDPNTSIEDYSRIMLEYTQRRMGNFADLEDDKGYATSRSSRSSYTSGKSGISTAGMLSRQGAAYTPSKIHQNSPDQLNGSAITSSEDSKAAV